MSDFSTTWKLSRGRLLDSIKGLSHNQLNYRLFPNTLTIGEMAIHVFGVEVSFVSQILNLELDEFGQKIKACATEGAVNDNPFPYSAEEITTELIERAEQLGLQMSEKIIYYPTPEIRKATLISALGPEINGEGALARMGFHPGYHHAQVYMIRQSPDFPTE